MSPMDDRKLRYVTRDPSISSYVTTWLFNIPEGYRRLLWHLILEYLLRGGGGGGRCAFEKQKWIWTITINEGVPSVTIISSTYGTHRDQDEMTTISQTTYSNAFPWMKINETRLRFRWNLFLRVQSTIFYNTGSDNGLAPTRRQAIIWTNDESKSYYSFFGNLTNIFITLMG